MKKKKSILSSESNKTLELPALGIIDNIVISKKEVWAYYILAEKPYDFLATPARVDLIANTMSSLGGLCQSATKRVDCHLQITNTPFNPESWEKQIRHIYNEKINRASLPFEHFIEEQRRELELEQFTKRVTYLGVKLFNRNSFDFEMMNVLEFSFKDVMEAARRGISNMFKFDAEDISELEENRARQAEQEIYRILGTSALMVRRPTAEDMILNIKSKLYPAMPTPFLETDHDSRLDYSDIVLETGGTVAVKHRWLEMTQPINNEIYKGYRATLSFSKFSDMMGFPSGFPPFLYRTEILPYIVNCRFTLIPTEEMKKQVANKKLETDDELNNLAESGQRVNQNIKETLSDIETIEADLEQGRLPWLVGSYRITVDATSEEELKTRIMELKQAYSESDTVLTWSSGDQLALFREDIFGGKLEINSYQQTTNLALLGVAGINYGNQVGDTIYQQTVYTRKR